LIFLDNSINGIGLIFNKMKKYNLKDKRLLATWALDCAERVLNYFEDKYPKDNRPRKAIETGREWIKTSVFKMNVIRKASLDSHSAARKAKENNKACFAARAAGQAVATAHVPQHAYGSAYYALKAIALADPINAEVNVIQERNWQSQNLPKHLRKEIMKRIIIEKSNQGIKIKIKKSRGF
jgi:hypothetical protein